MIPLPLAALVIAAGAGLSVWFTWKAVKASRSERDRLHERLETLAEAAEGQLDAARAYESTSRDELETAKQSLSDMESRLDGQVRTLSRLVESTEGPKHQMRGPQDEVSLLGPKMVAQNLRARLRAATGARAYIAHAALESDLADEIGLHSIFPEPEWEVHTPAPEAVHEMVSSLGMDLEWEVGALHTIHIAGLSPEDNEYLVIGIRPQWQIPDWGLLSRNLEEEPTRARQ